MNRNWYESEPGFKDLGLNRTEPNRGLLASSETTKIVCFCFRLGAGRQIEEKLRRGNERFGLAASIFASQMGETAVHFFTRAKTNTNI